MKIILYLDKTTDKRIIEADRAWREFLMLKLSHCDGFDCGCDPPTTNISECDISINFGVYCKSKHERSIHRKQLHDLQKELNHGILIYEVGFLNRSNFYSVGWNDIVGHGYYHTHNMPPDRWNKLGLTVKPNRINKSGYILLCGQLPWDTQLQHIDYIKWINGLIKKIRTCSSRKIVFRNHPDISTKHNNIIKGDFDNLSISKNKELCEDFKGAYVVVAFNSNSLLNAVIDGLPIFALDEGSMVYSIANTLIENIENPQFPDENQKLQTLYNIAYSQWSLDEIKTGACWDHIYMGYQQSKELRKNPTRII